MLVGVLIRSIYTLTMNFITLFLDWDTTYLLDWIRSIVFANNFNAASAFTLIVLSFRRIYPNLGPEAWVVFITARRLNDFLSGMITGMYSSKSPKSESYSASFFCIEFSFYMSSISKRSFSILFFLNTF